MANKQIKVQEEHLARAKTHSLPVSTKHCVEICRTLRYKTISQAKKILEEVFTFKKAIPFKRHKKDTGHKPGIAAGRFPQKASKEVLRLLKAVEANAQFKGLNTSSLKITKILANKAPAPSTGGRHRHTTRRTHLEIEVTETKEKKKPKDSSPPEAKKEAKKPKVKKEEKNKEKAEEAKIKPVGEQEK